MKFNKKGDIKLIVGIIIAIFAMFLVIRFISNNLIDSTDQIKFCKDSVDWDGDGIPDRADPCLCEDESRCKTPAGRLECKKERSDELCKDESKT